MKRFHTTRVLWSGFWLDRQSFPFRLQLSSRVFEMEVSSARVRKQASYSKVRFAS
jgi:hypothetical protein